MDEERVDRCDCINKRFADLLAYGDLVTAQTATECGLECEGCLPWLKLAFATGETSFDVDDPRIGS